MTPLKRVEAALKAWDCSLELLPQSDTYAAKDIDSQVLLPARLSAFIIQCEDIGLQRQAAGSFLKMVLVQLCDELIVA